MATSSQDFRLQTFLEMAVEAWDIAHSTCEFDNLLMRSNRRRKDQIGLALCLRPVRSRNDSMTVNGHLHLLMCLVVAAASVTWHNKQYAPLRPSTGTKDQS